ncbi:MAG: ABC transporter ATP-binding protein, partial [Rhodospirillales bacterium]|nr:ABC transporter ATP-binding protein [Rhodospirillales bacterium]
MSLLAIDDLTIALPQGADRPHAVDGVSLTLDPGEVLCIVGESGSGKSVSAGAVMGLLPPALKRVRGGITFEGRDMFALDAAGLRALRGARIGMIFQEPMTALNPLMRGGEQVAEVLAVHNVRGAATRVPEVL